MSRAPEDAMREIAGMRRADAIATADAAMRRILAGEERRTGERRVNPALEFTRLEAMAEMSAGRLRRDGLDRRRQPAAVQHYQDMADHAKALARVEELTEALREFSEAYRAYERIRNVSIGEPVSLARDRLYEADAEANHLAAALRGEP